VPPTYQISYWTKLTKALEHYERISNIHRRQQQQQQQQQVLGCHRYNEQIKEEE